MRCVNLQGTIYSAKLKRTIDVTPEFVGSNELKS